MSDFERGQAKRENVELIEFALLPLWEAESPALHGDRALALHNHQERIASLEYMIAMLLEKNEQIRQKLLAQMD